MQDALKCRTKAAAVHSDLGAREAGLASSAYGPSLIDPV